MRKEGNFFSWDGDSCEEERMETCQHISAKGLNANLQFLPYNGRYRNKISISAFICLLFGGGHLGDTEHALGARTEEVIGNRQTMHTKHTVCSVDLMLT